MNDKQCLLLMAAIIYAGSYDPNIMDFQSSPGEAIQTARLIVTGVDLKETGALEPMP